MDSCFRVLFQGSPEASTQLKKRFVKIIPRFFLMKSSQKMMLANGLESLSGIAICNVIPSSHGGWRDVSPQLSASVLPWWMDTRTYVCILLHSGPQKYALNTFWGKCMHRIGIFQWFLLLHRSLFVIVFKIKIEDWIKVLLIHT